MMILIMAGCTPKQDEALPEEDADNNDRIVQIEDSDPIPKKNITNQDLAAHLANVAGDLPNVSDASAMIAGPYAVVAIDVDKDLDRSRVGTIKYSVTEALQHDQYGKSAVVIADGDVVERLRRMGQKIGQGYPVQGIIDELAAIVGRYMPEKPIKHNRPEEPDQNKDIIDKNEKEKLEKTEQEQTNDRKKDD